MPVPAANRYHADFFETFEEIRRAVGDVAAQQVFKIITMRLGGQLLRVPDPHDLWREERDRQICNKLNGTNYQEVAIMYSLSVTQVRRIEKGSRR